MWKPGLLNFGLLNRSGAAASLIVHLAVLVLGLGYAGVRPFESVPAETIAVDIVTPEEVEEVSKEKPPETPDPPDTLNLADKAVPPEMPPPAVQSSAPQQPSGKPSPPDNSKSAPQKAAAKSAPAAAASQPAAAAPAQPTSPWLPNLPNTPQPDLSIKYQVNLGLMDRRAGDDDFDAPASSAAKVATDDVARFREQLKTCSKLPASVSPTDKVIIKLRANFRPDGRLATPPQLIEASASVKGPQLMQAAIAALQSCQPAALPADKYDEWKVLDLSFTPLDFSSG